MLLIVLCVLSLSCGSGPPEGSELVFAYPPGPLTLDPARCSTELDRILCSLVYSGIVRRELDGTFTPELGLPLRPPLGVDPFEWAQKDLTSRCASSNGLVYTFRLNPEARFANGREVTVEDIRFSLERLADPATESVNSELVEPILGALNFMVARRDQYEGRPADPVAADSIVGIDEIDPGTFRLQMTSPYAAYLERLALPAMRILPATETAAVIEAATEPFALASYGSGPWAVESIDPDREIVLKSKPDHWSGVSVGTERLRFLIIEDPSRAQAMFASEVLALFDPPVDERPNYMNDPTYRDQVLPATAPATTYLAFNFRKPFFRDIRIRQTIKQAVVSSDVVERVGRHRVCTARTIVPECVYPVQDVLHEETLIPKEKVDPSSWPPLLLVVSADPLLRETAEQIRALLEENGLDLSLRVTDSEEHPRILEEGTFDLALATLEGTSPDDFFNAFLLTEGRHGGRNISRYANTFVDTLVAQARSEPVRANRNKLYQQADDLLRKDCAAVFLWHPLDVHIRQLWLSGFRHSPIPTASLWNNVFRETSDRRYETLEDYRVKPVPLRDGVTILTVSDAVLLGFVQGLTEFLPISSSGHLKIAQRMFGLQGGSQYLFFDCLLHLGTLFAVLVFFRRDLKPLSKALLDAPRVLYEAHKENKKLQKRRKKKKNRGRKEKKVQIPEDVSFVVYLAVGTLVTAAFGLVFQDLLEFLFDSLPAIGFALVMTGLLLLSTQVLQRKEPEELTGKRAAIIGLAQGLAITPGLSRSGTTVATALLLGLSRETAVRFSFLLSVPAIAGATLLQAMDASRRVALLPALAGMGTAFISGLIFLSFLVFIVRKGQLHLFALYTIPLGIFVFLLAG